MRQSGGCKISATKKQSGRHSKSCVGRRCVVQANCPARSGLHQTLDDTEVVPPTEPKAVLEHRAPKTSPPILHSRNAESKVGRVPHVRDAPPSVHPERSGGQRTARPTKTVVPARATLERSKFWIEGQGFVRAGCCVRSGYAKLWTTPKSSINRTESGAGAPRSKNFYSNPSQQRRRE